MMHKILPVICLFCGLGLQAGLLREATVVLAGDAGPKARFAARELAYYIGEITGKTATLVTEEENVPGFKIQVGDTGDSGLDMSQCQYDGYWLKTGTDGNLLIAGRSDTGTAFGVYGFLQDVCGLRFYLPERAGTYVPRNADLMVAEQASLHNPFFRSRYLYAPMPYDNDWFLHNRGIERYKNLHALYGIITQAHAKTHPEYFAMVDGKRLLPENGREVWRQQPCMTNPEVIALTVQYALKYFREHPDEECVSLGINDSTKFCECPECVKANEGSGNTAIGDKSYAKLAIHFYNRVAEEVCKVYPDKFIGVLAYVNINHIPEGSQYHPNII
ncbi:MAG: DUF4838 domain-containing protein, partial [Lentisphaeria bacterium]|nr:DUF4838 domain-containing protein [Lentisphaeria bacterium]